MLCVDSVIYTRNSLKNYKLKPRKEGLRFKVFTKNDIQKKEITISTYSGLGMNEDNYYQFMV